VRIRTQGVYSLRVRLGMVLEAPKMRKKASWILVLALLFACGVMAYGMMSGGDRADCPGKIQCPLTGEWVCRDRCPVEADREKDAPTPACCRKPQ
jgi:hypothetical protein